ncbi:MAG: hypothetical protein GPJ12_08920 [Microcystis aeruginosa S11-01]|nr:hypothetical protein [Microcystis aeruginosa S11-01]
MLISFIHRWLTAPTEKFSSARNLSAISPGSITRVTGVSWSWLQNYVNVSTSLDVDPSRSRRVNNKLVAVPR